MFVWLVLAVCASYSYIRQHQFTIFTSSALSWFKANVRIVTLLSHRLIIRSGNIYFEIVCDVCLVNYGQLHSSKHDHFIQLTESYWHKIAATSNCYGLNFRFHFTLSYSCFSYSQSESFVNRGRDHASSMKYLVIWIELISFIARF